MWSLALGTEEGVVDHTVVEVTVRLLLSGFNLAAVRLELSLVQGGIKIFRMNTTQLSTLLTETEGGDRECLDTVRLDCSAWVDNQVKLLHDLVNVVGVTVTEQDRR